MKKKSLQLLSEKYNAILVETSDQKLVDEWMADWQLWRSESTPEIDPVIFRLFLIDQAKSSGRSFAAFMDRCETQADEAAYENKQMRAGYDLSDSDWEPEEEEFKELLWVAFERNYKRDFLPGWIQRQEILNKDNPGIEMDI